MASATLEESKMNLLLAHNYMEQVYKFVADAKPSHSSPVNDPITDEILEAQAAVRNTMAQIAIIINKRLK